MSTMKFCKQCGNILYPKEDKNNKVLLHICRHCTHQELADNNCVYRNEIQSVAGKTTQIFEYMASDSTLPRTNKVSCIKCKHGEAVFSQLKSRGEEGMTMVFVCCNPKCGHNWRY